MEFACHIDSSPSFNIEAKYKSILIRNLALCEHFLEPFIWKKTSANIFQSDVLGLKCKKAPTKISTYFTEHRILDL